MFDHYWFSVQIDKEHANVICLTAKKRLSWRAQTCEKKVNGTSIAQLF